MTCQTAITEAGKPSPRSRQGGIFDAGGGSVVLMRRRPLGGGFLMPPALRVERHYLQRTNGELKQLGI